MDWECQLNGPKYSSSYIQEEGYIGNSSSYRSLKHIECGIMALKSVLEKGILEC